MRLATSALVFLFLFSISYADVAAFQAANQSWNAGSSGNTFNFIWNFTTAENGSMTGGGSCSLHIPNTNSNCTSNQSFWNVSGGGLIVGNKTAVLTCGVAYASDNYNSSLRVNCSSNGGGNATNLSYASVTQLNTSVVVPVFTSGTRPTNIQKRSESTVSPVTVSVASVNAQAVQFACKVNDYQGTGTKCNVRVYSSITCNSWITTFDSAYSCWSLGDINAAGSVSVPVDVYADFAGQANIDWMIADADDDRNATQTQNMTIESKGRSTRQLQQQQATAGSGGFKLPSLEGKAGGIEKRVLLAGILIAIALVVGGAYALIGKRK